MSLSWINRNRSLELSPRVRLVDDAEADALRRKREALQWRPTNGFLKDEFGGRQAPEAAADRAA